MRSGLKFKLMGIFGLGSALLVAAAAYGIWTGWRNLQVIHSAEHVVLDSALEFHALERQYGMAMIAWKKALLPGIGEASFRQQQGEYATMHDEINRMVRQFRDRFPNSETGRMLTEFSTLYQTNHTRYLELLERRRLQPYEPLLVPTEVYDLDSPVRDLLKRIVEVGVADGLARSESIAMVAKEKIGVAVALLLVAFLAEGVLFVFLIRRFITLPAEQVVVALGQLEQRNFVAPIREPSDDEFGTIAHSVQAVAVELGTLIAHVKVSAGRLAKNAQQVSMVSAMTSEGIQNQKVELDQADHAMSAMSGFLQQAVDSASAAVAAAEDIRKQTDDVSHVVQETVDVTHNLASEMQGASDTIRVLDEETRHIGQSAAVIRGIADQTNLLALNAAIEAARAGEQGRGFAVVADEVRKLATLTQNATADIEQRIKALQRGADAAVSAMRAGCQRAEQSVEQTAATNRLLTGITEAASTIRGVNAQIADVLGQQTRVAHDIGQAMVNIGQVVAQSVYSADRTAMENNAIAGEAHLLHDLFSDFQVPAFELAENGASDSAKAGDDSVELF